MDDQTLEGLRVLEESLWHAETRFDDTLMDTVLAEDFCEFGRSGRIWQRHEMLVGDGIAGDIDAVLPLKDFRVRSLSADLVQVMYVSEVRAGPDVERANRSSIWKRDERGWRLCFHQATPTR